MLRTRAVNAPPYALSLGASPEHPHTYSVESRPLPMYNHVRARPNDIANCLPATTPFQFIGAPQKPLPMSPQNVSEMLVPSRIPSVVHPSRQESHHSNHPHAHHCAVNQNTAAPHLHSAGQSHVQPVSTHSRALPSAASGQLTRRLSQPPSMPSHPPVAYPQSQVYAPTTHRHPRTQLPVQSVYVRSRPSENNVYALHDVPSMGPLPSSVACPITSSNGMVPPNLLLEPSSFFVGSLTKDAFITSCSRYLDSYAVRNRDYIPLPTQCEPESVFFSVSKPDIGTDEYLRRLVTYTHCSPAAFVVTLIFMERIAARNSSLHVTPHNLHRLVITALTLACKVLDDQCFSNVHYGKVGGIPTVGEMNRLELQFLFFVRFELHVCLEEYNSKVRFLESYLAPKSPRSLFDLAVMDSPGSSPLPSPAAAPVANRSMGVAPLSGAPSECAPNVGVHLFRHDSEYGYGGGSVHRPTAGISGRQHGERDLRQFQRDPADWRPPPWAQTREPSCGGHYPSSRFHSMGGL